MAEEEEKKNYITLPEARELLESAAEERELTYEQNLALQHAQQFARLDPEKARKMKEDLLEVEGVNEYYATRIVDLLPTHPDDVRAIFSTDKTVLQLSQMESILEIVRKYI
jgi:DNA-directed RNA polymerase subunit F